jgi:NarL family two-component system sensor histidine kinase LiaS
MKELTKVPVHLENFTGDITISDEIIIHAYRIIQELMINAIKYVSSGTISLRCSTERNMLYIFYQDTGQGFDQSDMMNRNTLGLRNIYERATLLGGHATLMTSAGKGTRWTIRIPLKN